MPEVIVNQKYLETHPSIEKSQLVDKLLYGVWSLPVFGSNQWMPWMGTTGHKAMPSSISVNGKAIDIFAKPFTEGSNFMAGREFTNAGKVRSRNINTPGMIAIVDIDDYYSVLVGELLHYVEPFSARDMKFSLTDPRVYSPSDFLQDVLQAVADIHNKGVVHNDLHLGNLGHQFRKDHPPKIIFFDFEIADILSDHDLMLKNRGTFQSPDQQEKLLRFEEKAVGDIGVFLAHLIMDDFPIKDDLLKVSAQLYLPHRKQSYGLMSVEQLHQMLTTRCISSLKSIKRNT
ncbi:hypothetical protein HYW42_03745 [Candidatus Daviesbacteria bacterium]|nr:hypothetical protein [Candidatus Daviesbacteria bacterium]